MARLLGLALGGGGGGGGGTLGGDNGGSDNSDGDGFGWVTRDPDDPGQRFKPGFLSTAPGDRLQLQLRLGRVYRSIYLGTLVSYGEHMGWLRATCTAGCTCSPLLVRGRHRDRTSVVVNTRLPLLNSLNNAACTLQLEHLRASGRPAGAPQLA